MSDYSLQMILNISAERRNKIAQLDNRIMNNIHKTISGSPSSSKRLTNINDHYHCIWCTYPFSHEKCIIPIQKVNDVFEGFGSFCSYNCAYTYIRKDGTGITNVSNTLSLLQDMHLKEYGTYFDAKIMPHRMILERFTPNGITIDEYRENMTKSNIDIIPIFPAPVERSVSHEIRVTGCGFFTIKQKN